MTDDTINTGGGAHVPGAVSTGGGDFVGRDKITNIYNQAPPRLPLQRPPRAVHFKDRQAELKQLLEDLKLGKVVTLCGPGGIGKSALAAEAIWTLAPGETPPALFPDGIIFHNFYHRPQADLALEAIARAYGEELKPTPLDAAQRALAGRKALLLLDGTEEADNLSAVLSVAGGCGVIVTSRRHKDAPERWQDIEPLPPDEALELLQAWGQECAADKSAAQSICDLVGRLPLAVRLVGRYLAEAQERAADYLAWLEETPLEALDQGKRREESVPLLLERSLAQVSEQARQALGVAGLLALAPFNREVVAVGLGVEAASAGWWLGELVNYGLLLRREDRYEVSHALIHRYARERMRLPGEAAERLAGYYADLAEEQSRLGVVGYAALDGERAHILAVAEQATQQGASRAALRLVWAGDKYLMFQGYPTERRTALQTGLAAARNLPDRGQEANCIKALGDVHLQLAEYEAARARYEEARPIYAGIGARLGEANCIQALGDVHLQLDEYEAARARYEEARPIYAGIGDRLGEANCIKALGDVHLQLAEYEAARARYEEARPIYAGIGARLGEANCIKALGDVHLQLAEYEAARARYEEARPIYAGIGDRLGEANCIRALGDVHLQLAEYEAARARYEEARPIYAGIGDRHSLAATLAYLGLTYKGLAQPGPARQYLSQAVALFEAINSPYANLVRGWLTDLDEESQ